MTARTVTVGSRYKYRPLFGSSALHIFEPGETIWVARQAYPEETEKTGYWLAVSLDNARIDLVSTGSLDELDRS